MGCDRHAARGLLLPCAQPLPAPRPERPLLSLPDCHGASSAWVALRGSPPRASLHRGPGAASSGGLKNTADFFGSLICPPSDRVPGKHIWEFPTCMQLTGFFITGLLRAFNTPIWFGSLERGSQRGADPTSPATRGACAPKARLGQRGPEVQRRLGTTSLRDHAFSPCRPVSVSFLRLHQHLPCFRRPCLCPLRLRERSTPPLGWHAVPVLLKREDLTRSCQRRGAFSTWHRPQGLHDVPPTCT